MVMPTLWQRFIDTLLPPADVSRTIRPETNSSFFSYYKPQHKNDILTLGRYQDEVMQAAIAANKFHNDRHATQLLAGLISHHLQTISDRPVQIVPIPLSTKRQAERGYNQVTLVLQYLLPYLAPGEVHIINALDRPVNTPPQTQLEREERLQNVTAAFKSNRRQRHLNYSTPIWILDDVATTGATLHAAQAAFPPHRQRHIQLIALAG